MNDQDLIPIYAPSKTFLLGEYVALNGGPAILIATPPYFSLENTPSDKAIIIASESPAGKLIVAHQTIFAQTSLQFIDPYAGLGGFGASSAQFALFAKYLGINDAWTVWEQYQQYAAQNGVVPSGADVVAQWMGGITYFHPQQRQLEKLTWPFPNLSLALIHTGKKLATHVHLQNLQKKDYSPLQKIVQAGYRALREANIADFCEVIDDYANHLANLDLVAEHTKILLERLDYCPMVISRKGCGALGADVVLAVILSERKQEFTRWAKRERLKLIYCDNQFAEGISA